MQWIQYNNLILLELWNKSTTLAVWLSDVQGKGDINKGCRVPVDLHL